MANEDIKTEMKSNKVRTWQLADKLGFSEETLYRRFRRELDEETKERYLNAIKEILEERKK